MSYYYQYSAIPGSVALHGRVTDANGVPLAGATVSAMVYLTPVAQATTDANGDYSLPNLDAGIYDLQAWDFSYQTSIRALTLNASTAEQNFQLQSMPVAPPTQQVNRQPPFTPVFGPMGSTLKIFNGTIFTNIDANNEPSTNLMTIVLTHGWIPPGTSPADGVEGWPAGMASDLWTKGVTTKIANIVAWDWTAAASGPIPPEENTPSQGVALGESLTNVLGLVYSQPIHFIGRVQTRFTR